MAVHKGSVSVKRTAWSSSLLSGAAAAALLAPALLGGPAAAATRRAPSNGGTLVIAQQTEPDSLDNAHTILAASYQVFAQIYDTLVVQTGVSSYAGEIAQSWNVSKNGMVYTFQIRKGLKFSNGDPLNANAVAFTFNRIMNPKTKSPDTGLIGPIKSVVANGPYQVTMTLTQPFAYELGDLAVAYAGIEDPIAVQKEGANYGRNPVGSGPFMLKSWVSGESITLVPNPYYHSFAPYDKNHGTAKLAALKFQFIANQESEIASLQSGETNMIEALPQANYNQFKNNSQFHIQMAPGQDIVYMEFKIVTKGKTTSFVAPYNDINVRRAAGYAVDPAGIVQAANYGLGRVQYGLIPYGEDAYDPALKSVGFHYDPALAKSLLTKAGWKVGAGGVRFKNGQPLTATLWVFSLGAFPQDGQILANELQAVGFKTKIVTQQIATFIAEYPKGNFNTDVIGLGWPNSSIFNVQMTLGQGSGNYPDPTLLAMLKKAEGTQNAAQRAKLYDQAQAYDLKMAYAIPLYTDVTPVMTSTKVHGVVITPGNAFDFVNTTVG